MNKFMHLAVKAAERAVRSGHGGPFGAVIVRKNKVIANAHNQVLKNKDATCHAEIQAIRLASKKLKRFNLSDCTIYTSCEPCPMCFSAIYWAKIKTVYYGCTKSDADKLGFGDKKIYEVLEKRTRNKHLKEKQIDREECLKPFKLWKEKKNKVRY